MVELSIEESYKEYEETKRKLECMVGQIFKESDYEADKERRYDPTFITHNSDNQEEPKRAEVIPLHPKKPIITDPKEEYKPREPAENLRQEPNKVRYQAQEEHHPEPISRKEVLHPVSPQRQEQPKKAKAPGEYRHEKPVSRRRFLKAAGLGAGLGLLGLVGYIAGLPKPRSVTPLPGIGQGIASSVNPPEHPNEPFDKQKNQSRGLEEAIANLEFDSCRRVSPNEPLSVILSEPCLSPSLIDRILRENGSKAAGTGQLFYDLGRKYGIDPAVALAFFGVESTFGKFGAAKETRSIGNIRPGSSWRGDVYRTGRNGSFRKYSTWEDGIEDWFKLIKEGKFYVRMGRTTVEEIVPKLGPGKPGYAPNNPSAYIRKVRKFVNEFRDRALQDKRNQVSKLSINEPTPISLLNLYTNQELNEDETVLVVDKSNYELQLWQYKGNELRSIGKYMVSIGSNGLGPKERRGDKKTPEGDYILTLEDHHTYGWPTYRLNYPNPADLALKSTGSGILIHATGYHRLGKEITGGCIGMIRKDLKDILQKGVGNKTKILIRPNLAYFPEIINISRR